MLIGAGDARYLALAGVVNLVVYLPALAGLAWLASGAARGGQAPDAGVQLALLWAGFAGVFMGARAVTLGLRARSDAWMRTGEH